MCLVQPALSDEAALLRPESGSEPAPGLSGEECCDPGVLSTGAGAGRIWSGWVASSFLLTWHMAKAVPLSVFVVALTAVPSWYLSLFVLINPPVSKIPEFSPNLEHIRDWCPCSSGSHHWRESLDSFHLSRSLLHVHDKWYSFEQSPSKCLGSQYMSLIYHCMSLVLSFFIFFYGCTWRLKRIKPIPSAVRVWSPNHWTTTDILNSETYFSRLIMFLKLDYIWQSLCTFNSNFSKSCYSYMIMWCK